MTDKEKQRLEHDLERQEKVAKGLERTGSVMERLALIIIGAIVLLLVLAKVGMIHK